MRLVPLLGVMVLLAGCDNGSTCTGCRIDGVCHAPGDMSSANPLRDL